MTFNIKDMNITLNAFGAVVKAEGQAVSYDQELIEVVDCSDHEIEFEATDAEEVSDG